VAFYHGPSKEGKKMDTERSHVTVAEAAEMLNRSRYTIHWAIDKGYIQAERAGVQMFLIARSEIENYRKTHLSTRDTAPSA